MDALVWNGAWFWRCWPFVAKQATPSNAGRCVADRVGEATEVSRRGVSREVNDEDSDGFQGGRLQTVLLGSLDGLRWLWEIVGAVETWDRGEKMSCSGTARWPGGAG